MIILAVAAVVGVVAFVLLWRELAAQNRPRKLSKVAGASAGVLGAVLLALTATGKLPWLAALFAAILPFARWVLSLLMGPLIGNLMRGGFAFNPFRGQQSADGGASGSAAPKASTVSTAELRMTLDHETGDMDGDVLAGTLAGQRLSTLDLPALSALYGELGTDDSRQLLGAYLDRRFPGWADAGGHENADASTRRDPPTAAEMDKTQALAVLGLTDSATKEEVIAAHRRLMQKLHPDRGGTDYLAATLNRAKEVLLR